MEQAANRPEKVVSRKMRRMRVAFGVRAGMMLAMVGDPLSYRSLKRHRTEDCKRHTQRPSRLEGAVREQTVIADGDAEPGRDVKDAEQDEGERTEGHPPQESRGRKDPKGGSDNGDDRYRLAYPGGMGTDGCYP